MSSQQAAKLRGIQVNNKVMKQCVELVKSVREIWKNPSILEAVTQSNL